ncbi:MAG: MgtC/SapB family protein [Patescibacteria group bacterium]
MEFIFNPDLAPYFQLTLATLLGMLLGIERLLIGKTAGPRTYALVSMGSCLLTVISLTAANYYPVLSKADPVSIVASVITGIGFIGAGLIIFKGSKLSGLTTAAGIWVAAAIGIVVGFSHYLLALFATFLTLFVFTLMWNFENKIKKMVDKQPHHHNHEE